MGVASNRSTSPRVLAKLSKDENERVRLEVARNPRTPQAVLDKLSDDVRNADLLAPTRKTLW